MILRSPLSIPPNPLAGPRKIGDPTGFIEIDPANRRIHAAGAGYPLRIDALGGPGDMPCLKRLCGLQDDETWSETNCTITRDLTPANVKHGDRSLKIVIPAGNTATASCTLPFEVTVRNMIGIWMKIDDISHITNFSLSLYSGPTGGYHKATIVTSGVGYWPIENDTWRLIWIPRHYFAEISSPDPWTTTKPVQRVVITAVATGAELTIHIGDIIAQDFPRAGIVLGFDGPYTPSYTVAYPDMAARGWRGTLWCVANSVRTGVTGYMTPAQITVLHDAGWDVGSHSWQGTVYTTSTPAATVRQELEMTRRYLLSQGWYRSTTHSWQGNEGKSAVDPDTGDKAGDLAKRFFLDARSISSFKAGPYTGVNSLMVNKAGGWIPIDWYAIPYYETTMGDQYDFEGGDPSTKDMIDLAIQDHSVLCSYTHKIVETPGPNDISLGKWAAMVAYLDEKVAAGEIEVITMSDWHNRIDHRCGGVRLGLDGYAYAMDGSGATRPIV
ncbi:MAG: polysaccharide deacetylase family protein [Phycisphaerae bacterium]|nr:polysaccharide deacetylase family protein [Phycisphaerae bacterium]